MIGLCITAIVIAAMIALAVRIIYYAEITSRQRY